MCIHFCRTELRMTETMIIDGTASCGATGTATFLHMTYDKSKVTCQRCLTTDMQKNKTAEIWAAKAIRCEEREIKFLEKEMNVTDNETEIEGIKWLIAKSQSKIDELKARI